MKQILLILIVYFNIIFSSPAQEIIALTYNIRYNNPQDGENSWPNRKNELCRHLIHSNSDIIALQEVLIDQKRYIDSSLTNYSSWGVCRDDGFESGESVPIYYKNKIFNKLDGGHFWLSKHTEIPGSRDWDAALTRMASWLLLQHNISKKIFLIINTHWDHIGDSARYFSAQIIKDFANKFNNKYAIILLGDLNSTPEGIAYNNLVNTNSGNYFSALSTHTSPTFYGFNANKNQGKRIDYILFSGILPAKNKSEILYWKRNKYFYLSDHLAVKNRIKY